MKIISIGEIVWDVFEDSESIGGAPLNFAINANRLGHDLCFISAVGEDDRGDKALQYVTDSGLSIKFIKQIKGFSTGYVDVAIDREDGNTSYVIHRPAAYDFPALSLEQLNKIRSFAPDWIYFGTVQQMSDIARDLRKNLVELNPRAKRFYDMNLRSGNYTKELIKELLMETSILKGT